MRETLANMYEGSAQVKENKLQSVLYSFNNFKMKARETIDQMDMRMANLLNKAMILKNPTLKRK